MTFEHPESYPHRILLAVTGLSPQVVTETIYALAMRGEPRFVPTEVHLLTTREGAHRARLALLSQDPGWFQRLITDYAHLHRIARSVVEAQRGLHPTHVFTYRGRSTTRMLNKGWLRSSSVAGLPQVRVHDLKHTFGRRQRAASVSFEDRQDLLGHRSSRITTHYSAAELSKLIEAA
jgi:integrase